MKLTNKRAVVTGAASGIGKAIALSFAREGADVVVLDINAEKSADVVSAIQALGRKSLAIKSFSFCAFSCLFVAV
jgi:NAD(P)-dependent dehydrogenase (short-subunit alcohol dehydrogenase family)